MFIYISHGKERKICYQFCSAITNLALALNLLIYHSTILKFCGGGGGGGEIPGHPPLCMKPCMCTAIVSTVYHLQLLVGCLDWMEWNGGMEWWNGMVEWNGGMEWWNGIVERWNGIYKA